MQNKTDISVIFATYNRAEILRETLEIMTRLDHKGLKVEFVVVDNNSSDGTKAVVESFKWRLPLVYLFEPKAGKNCALNKALREVKLGEIIVFTDDDVSPRKNWLTAMAECCERWPEVSVFGGRINPIWPQERPPIWAEDKGILELGFGSHDYGDKESRYENGVLPFGANLWVRREVFSGKRFYDEGIGPRPTGRTMGSETSLLRKLRDESFEMVYCPAAVIGHRIESHQLSRADIRKRAYRYGKGVARIGGVCRKGLLERQPVLWYLLRICAVIKYGTVYLGSLLFSYALWGYKKSVESMKWFAYNVECLRLARSRG